MPPKKNVILCILDGVGIGPNNDTNALYVANTPTLDMLNSKYPHSELKSDGKYVGVPSGQMGNSEVGHITIGTGRVMQQSLVKISADLNNGKFENNEIFLKFLDNSKNSRAIHLVGLLSDGGIHSHIEHTINLCTSLNKLHIPIFVHAITDGRDTAVNAGIEQIQAFQKSIETLKNVQLASIIGRFYAMDRDNRWDRTELAWDLYTKGIGGKYASISEALLAGYNEGLSDEHIKPSLIDLDNQLDPTIQNGDSVFLFNFRGDRMRQLTRCFLNLKDDGFKGSTPNLHTVACMTQYDPDFKDKCCIIYPPISCQNSLGEVVADAGLKQLRIAETEKYAHVTFFFNNGREEPFNLENRILIPSPRDVATYDLKPEMALPELTSQLTKIILSREYNLIVLNIANADMVGHTGNFKASIKAVEQIDSALKEILSAVDSASGDVLIIADHGNIEQMSKDGSPSTTHTLNPVPCIYYGKKDCQLRNGSLSDVAPTILDILDLNIPEQMTGKSLFKK
jgi:2,3-bisphosphoglycerate-independent phosphoglycerate mutase